MKILVVEDSQSMREMIQFVLEGEGHEVITASDGVDGWTEIVFKEFDLVITDLNMPRMNGQELTERIRSGEKNKFIPILFLTTESQLDKKDQAKKAGATGWVVKPFKPEQLIKIINKFQ
jgi:two-component system chemotaxis response regulator CheY